MSEALSTPAEIDCLLVVAKPEEISQRLLERAEKHPRAGDEAQIAATSKAFIDEVSNPYRLGELCDSWLNLISRHKKKGNWIVDSSESRLAIYEADLWLQVRKRVFDL